MLLLLQAIYFLSFILFSTYYGLNLFVGVIVNNFTRLNQEMTGRALLTTSQQKWKDTERLLQSIKVCFQLLLANIDRAMLVLKGSALLNVVLSLFRSTAALIRPVIAIDFGFQFFGLCKQKCSRGLSWRISSQT